MKEALIDGGTLLVLLSPRDGGFSNFFEEVIQDPRWNQYTPRYSLPQGLDAEGYRSLLEDLGFKIVQFQLKDKKITFKDREELSQFMKIWVNYAFPLPNELQEDFLNAVLDRIIEYSSNEDSYIQLPFKGLILKAKI